MKAYGLYSSFPRQLVCSKETIVLKNSPRPRHTFYPCADDLLYGDSSRIIEFISFHNQGFSLSLKYIFLGFPGIKHVFCLP